MGSDAPPSLRDNQYLEMHHMCAWGAYLCLFFRVAFLTNGAALLRINRVKIISLIKPLLFVFRNLRLSLSAVVDLCSRQLGINILYIPDFFLGRSKVVCLRTILGIPLVHIKSIIGLRQCSACFFLRF